jgi:hypothetical protein
MMFLWKVQKQHNNKESSQISKLRLFAQSEEIMSFDYR